MPLDISFACPFVCHGSHYLLVANKCHVDTYTSIKYCYAGDSKPVVPRASTNIPIDRFRKHRAADLISQNKIKLVQPIKALSDWKAWIAHFKRVSFFLEAIVISGLFQFFEKFLLELTFLIVVLGVLGNAYDVLSHHCCRKHGVLQQVKEPVSCSLFSSTQRICQLSFHLRIQWLVPINLRQTVSHKSHASNSFTTFSDERQISNFPDLIFDAAFARNVHSLTYYV